MENIDEIIKSHGVVADSSLPYAGALKPGTAFEILSAYPAARIVDVRTRAEREWVGYVPESLHIEWNQWPEGARNPNFAAELGAAVPDKNTPVLFLCRSGVRSHGAASAAKELGYRYAFNVLEGFEGDKDVRGHRNTIGGWRVAGLPWIQG
jgi:rhodanese-related sulfurtransferase